MKKLLILVAIPLFTMVGLCNAEKVAEDQASEIAMKFMEAMTTGDMDTMVSLMHDDMVWHNEGDSSIPWIGPWNGKKDILEKFMPAFGKGLKTTEWNTEDTMSNGDTVAYFGTMAGLLTNSEEQTKKFTFALRIKVKDGKIILWNWFEDSFEISRAFHAEPNK